MLLVSTYRLHLKGLLLLTMRLNKQVEESVRSFVDLLRIASGQTRNYYDNYRNS